MRLFVTQRIAINAIREATGMSWDLCRRRVAAMAMIEDGHRRKVSRIEVRQAISEMSAPPAKVTAAGMKPVSDHHLRSIRATAQTEQIVNKLNTRQAA